MSCYDYQTYIFSSYPSYLHLWHPPSPPVPTVKVGADYVAASFIRTPDNVRSVVAYLERCIANLPEDYHNNPHPPLRPLVISKIESKEGVDNFDAILEESDGIMVARGDLGVEIPFSKVFAAQRMMVAECNRVGKPVIVATQMLDSMMRNPRPTRYVID